jgi:hypothetical protein
MRQRARGPKQSSGIDANANAGAGQRAVFRRGIGMKHGFSWTATDAADAKEQQTAPVVTMTLVSFASLASFAVQSGFDRHRAGM